MKKQLHKNNKLIIPIIFIVIISVGAALLYGLTHTGDKLVKKLYDVKIPEYFDSQILPIGLSRKGIELDTVEDIVIHYIGNPGTTAQQNHDYFANPTTTVNSHFIVGLDGEIIQCVPLYERSSASNHRNKDTISIEVCHLDETGEFSDITKESLIKLVAWLCETCDLDKDDIIRHYDITGKFCPLYYVQNESEWENLLNDFENEIEKEREK